MKIIGITGGVGAGKTQILEYLSDKYGASVCQTDKVAKKLQKKGGICYDPIVEHFGTEILDEKGELDRKKLSDIVFGDPKELSVQLFIRLARLVLNEIVHPAVKEEVNKKIKKEERKNTNLLIVESAVLVEDHYNEICDELWYIYVEDAVRRNRLYYSRGYDNKKIDGIIAAQLPKEMFLKACDRVIDNSGIFAETMIQIDQIVKEL